MGVTGSILAWELRKHGYEVSWEDPNTSTCAWKASTGLVYPSGDITEQQAYESWRCWHRGAAGWHGIEAMEECIEEGAFWFSTLHPPHGARYGIAGHVGPLRLAAEHSVHVNVQAFVENSRSHFRQGTPRAGAQWIVTHGYSRRLDHYLWGWSARVSLQIDPQLITASAGLRPTFYLRRGRYQFGYANLIPGESGIFYAGSSLIVQKQAHQLAVNPKYDWWKRHVRETAEGLITPLRVLSFREGWRPVAAKGDGEPITEIEDGAWLLRPMGSSGVRMAPLLCHAVLEKLGG
jgi:hypothetical protein